LSRRALPVVLAVGLGLMSAGCDHATEREVSTREATGPRITVTEQARQMVEGWGASVVGDTFLEPLVLPGLTSSAEVNRLDRLVFSDAGINIVRVFGPGYGTQFETGDVQPRASDARFAFMKRASRFGVRFMLTGADAPAAMKDGNNLAHGSEAAYAEYLAEILRVAKEDVGVPFAYAALTNEPDNSAALLNITPEQAALVYERLAQLIEEEGLDTKLVLGDNTGWRLTLDYASTAAELPTVREAAAAIASHAYGGSSREMQAVAELARANDLSVWQTEWGTGCPDCPDDRSMESGLEWSRKIAEGLVQAETSIWFTFRAVADSTHGPGDALIVRQRDHPNEPFYTNKRFEAFRHYSSAAPPGSERLEVTIRQSDLLAVAFRRGESIAVVVTNSAGSPRRVFLDLGEQSGSLRAHRTSQREDFRPLAPRRYEGKPISVELPESSITTFRLE
jgi:O-glycosyl hydrolase